MRRTAGPLGLQKVARLGLLGLLGLFLALNAPAALMKSVRRIKEGWNLRDETLIESRKRLSGEEYVDGIEAIRRSIPPDGVYLLLKESAAEDEADLWVRYDLAPRRAVLLDQSKALLARELEVLQGKADELPRYSVIVLGQGKAPQLMDTRLLFPGHSETKPPRPRSTLPSSPEP
jgi:hypothetical protein